MDELTDDLVEAVLLRLPPADPACLARAALACRRWCRLISDPGFRRRFRELHRHPPTLGFFGGRLHRTIISDDDSYPPPLGRFRPASSSFRPPYADVPEHWTPLDARHSRVLFHDDLSRDLIVFSPITGDVHRLPVPRLQDTRYNYWGATLLCAAAGCDHLDCPWMPFVVVAVLTHVSESCTSACIYSSETGSWRVTASIKHQIGSVVSDGSCAFAGNALYFEFVQGDVEARILEYDFGKQELSLIDLPIQHQALWFGLLLVEKDNGGSMGLAVSKKSKVYMWCRQTSQNGWVWAQNSAIELETFLPGAFPNSSVFIKILAFVDSINMLSVEIFCGGIFNLHINSGLANIVGEFGGYILPYTSFYIPSVGSSLKALDCEGLIEEAPSA